MRCCMNLIRFCWAEHCSDRQEDGNVSKIKSYTNLSGNVTVHYDEETFTIVFLLPLVE